MLKPLQLSVQEQELQARIRKLKENSGSHSPSVSMLKQALPEVEFRIDACFLSNPYATDLFMSYLEKDIISTGELRQLLEFYPAQNSEIAQQLGKSVSISADRLFIANGASEAIYAVMKNFTGKKLAVILPTFSPYYEFAKPGQEICYYRLKKENNFELDTEDYLEFVRKEGADTAVLINPNNPNGNYIRADQMQTLLKELANMKSIIVDESFIHFAYEDPDYSPVSVAGETAQYPNLIVVKSMSKDFGIAGVRAGYAVMAPERVKELLGKGYLWNSNGLSEYFFLLYTKPEFAKEYEPLRKRHIAETQHFIEKMSLIPGLKVYPSMGNFLLAELPQGWDAATLTIALLYRYGIYIRNCADKKGLEGNFVRVASRTQKENEQILEAFSEIFS